MDIAEETGPCLRFDLGYERALGLIDELSAMCMVNSAATATVYGRFIPPHKLRVVAQAVDWNVVRADTRHDTTSVWPADTMRCLMIASLVPWKGQTDAIRAMAVLRDRRVPATLVLAGKGVGTGYETEIAGLITELELADRVTLLEDFVDPAAFIRAADVVLVCSLCEAFGRITVEATRLGKPVVGTNSGATPELVREGFNGLLYAPGDDQALADRIAYLRARPDEAVRLGRNGAEWAAAEFGPERYAGAASVCFEEAVGIGGQVDRGGRTVMGLLSARMLALGRERLGFEREARALEMECRGLETECGGLERQLTELRQQPLVQVSGVLRREGPSGLVRRSLRRLLGRRRVREDVRAGVRVKPMGFDVAKTTVAVFSHPNHELAVFGLLQRLRPTLLYLTDGGAEERIAQTREGLSRIGLLERDRFLDYTEESFYNALLERSTAFFLEVASRVRAVCREVQPAQVLCDAVEFYNPVHDIALPIVRAALAEQPGAELFEVPLVYQRPGAEEAYELQRFPDGLKAKRIEIALTDSELRAKLESRDRVYTSLGRQMGPLLLDLPADHAALEVLAPAVPTLPVPDAHRVLRYEWRARHLQNLGTIGRPITYGDHYAPVASPLGWGELGLSDARTSL